jgi:hypothetical protein
LEQDAVDLLRADDAGVVPHGFEERTDAEVASVAQDAFAGAHDKAEGVVVEGGVSESDAVEFAVDALLGVIRSERT